MISLDVECGTTFYDRDDSDANTKVYRYSLVFSKINRANENTGVQYATNTVNPPYLSHLGP